MEKAAPSWGCFSCTNNFLFVTTANVKKLLTKLLYYVNIKLLGTYYLNKKSER